MRFDFGDFALDTDRRELTRGAELISIGPKVFDVLVYLVENRNRVVSKDELLDAVWDGRIVSESTLTSHINAVRKALGDTGDQRNLVRTLARKGFRFVGEVATGQPPADATPSTPNEGAAEARNQPPTHSDKPSIAVLPFANMSSDPEQEYFADGITEDLITDLSKMPGLFVIARNSTFVFKGQTIDVRRAAEQLDVRHVLEGSVRKAGGRVRINAQLIDAASGGHIWAERYDGNLEDIFSLQDDITARIVSALQLSLTPADQAPADRKPTDSVKAYDLFLQGRAYYHRYTHDDLFKAIKCFGEAIETDPSFADPYSFLAYCEFQGFNQMLPGYDDALERGSKLAERGVALDGSSAIALIRLAWIQTWLHRFEQAIANLEKALALAPSNGDVLATFGNVLNFCGDPQRGLQMMEKALSVEPFAPPNWEFQIGRSCLLLGQYEQAVIRFKRMAESAPRFIPAYTHLAFAYMEMGRTKEAGAAIKTVLQINPRFSVKAVAKRLPYRIDAVRDRFLESLRSAGMPEGEP